MRLCFSPYKLETMVHFLGVSAMKTKIVLMLVVAMAMLAGANVARGDMVTRTIQDEYDDGEEYLNTADPRVSYAQGAGWLDSSDLELGREDTGTNWQVIAVQYDQLGIPQGATITSAKLTFTIDNSGVEGRVTILQSLPKRPTTPQYLAGVTTLLSGLVMPGLILSIFQVAPERLHRLPGLLLVPLL
jgi:hypothetical protein